MHTVCVVLFVIAIAVAASASEAPTPLDVAAFGAVGDGASDDTAAFQRALDAAGATGGVVTVPPRTFRIAGTLTIPRAVTLEGSFRGEHTTKIDRGTTLLAFAGRGDENSTPFIQLTTNSAVKGVTIVYPEQTVANPQPYPWTIRGGGQHYDVIDVTIANAWNGVDCGTLHNEGHHLRNVFLCALRRGVYIDNCTDVGRIENVHIHSVYWWRVDDAHDMDSQTIDSLNAYTAAHLEGFIVGRTDWEYVSGCFVIWAKTGWHFIASPGGPAAGVGNCVITQSGSDIGPLAVEVDQVQSHAGLAFENCQFMSGVHIGRANAGPVKFTGCGFWGRPSLGSQVVLEGDNTTFLTACHFNDWDQNAACVDARRGALLLTACDFMQANGTHVVLGEDVAAAAITANRFRRAPTIDNRSHGDVQIQANLSR